MSETKGAETRRLAEGYYDKYLQGKGLDVGFAGAGGFDTVTPDAIGIDVNYLGYDGIHLPFPDESQDFVYNSHTLEHIRDYQSVIKEWYRVLKVGGYLCINVPHCFLYEKKLAPPSKFNGDHIRFYKPSDLLREVEESLEPNSYRVRHLKDCDYNFDYGKIPSQHSSGEYSIELVLQKIKKPDWKIE